MRKRVFTRTIVVLWNIVPMILSFVRDFKRYIFWGTGRLLTDEGHRQRAKKLTKILGDLGPTFIKIAQVLSARADVFPEIYLLELSTLQDKVEPNSTDEIIRVLEEDLQKPVEFIFDDFDEQPLAAASLGQVHRARYQGQPVVIKVLRPGVRQLVLTDLIVIRGILKVLNGLFRDSQFLRSLIIALKEFHRVILEEMDFGLEARNVKTFQRKFAGDDFVIIPKVYDELTTQNVIVLEYLEGVKISDVDALENMGIDIDLMLQRFAKTYIDQFMIHGVLHADPHPGNVFVNRHGQLILVDFGMVVRIEDDFKRHIIKCGVALAQNDIDGLVHELYELGLVEPGTNKAMLRDLAELLLEMQERGKLSERKVQQVVMMLTEAFYEFPFMLPPELVYIGRAVTLIEGIGFIHDPWFDAVGIVKPLIKEVARDVLREELQENLRDTVQQWAVHSYQTVTALQDVILKTDREQLRLRLHPADLDSISMMIWSVARRILVGLCAIALGIVSAIIYLRSGDTFILSTGVFFSQCWLMFLILRPSKKIENRQHRAIRQQVKMMTTEDGELYKSLVIAQMTPEEREQAEARRQKARR